MDTSIRISPASPSLYGAVRAIVSRRRGNPRCVARPARTPFDSLLPLATEFDLNPEAAAQPGHESTTLDGTPKERAGRVSSYLELTKPGIAVYVAMTTGACFYVAAAGRPDWLSLGHTVLGTLIGTSGALALNQYVEREVDSRMHRTRGRPLPSGRLQPREALVFGVVLLLGGVLYLWSLSGWLPSLLTAASAAAYLWLYTPLKSRSYLATVVGAFPGAFPALIGWTAARGAVELGGIVLFGMAFLWQLPHVLGLAWLLKEDYERAGFFMTPPSDATGERIGRHMVYHSISLLFVSVAPTLLGLAGPVYLLGAVLLGLGMIAISAAAARNMTGPSARRVFFASLLYQPLILGLLVLDTVRT